MKLLFSILIFILSFSSLAKEHIVQTKGGKMIFKTADNEISQRKFFGADLWFTGEVKNKKRNVMSVIYNSSDITLDNFVDPKQFEKYKEKMHLFGEKRKYQDIKIKPHKHVKINNENSYHSFVWSYKKDGINYIEQSYYVTCGKIFFVAKATTFESSKEDQSKFKKIVETAKCIE